MSAGGTTHPWGDCVVTNNSKAQRAWARVAGLTFLLLIALFMGADLATRNIAGSGSFAETAARIVTAAPLYRALLAVNVIGSALTVVLAAALYAVLRPANAGLARLALLFRLAEAFLEGFTCAAAFAIARLYATPLAGFDAQQMQALVSLLRALQSSMFHIVTIFFGLGSTLFFWLFITSRAIPRPLAVFGLLASLIVPALGLAGLIVPESAKAFQSGWYPMLITELLTGAWLLLFAVKTTSSAKE